MRLKFLFLLLWVGLSQASAEERITIGVGPWFDDQTMTEGYQHFIRYMESTIGVSVEFHVAKDYHDLVNKIAHQRVDIGFFAPASYVEAKAEIPGLYYLATVVYRNKKGELTDHYSSYIVVHKDSGYQSLEDLRDKRFAFTEFHSTSGYLYPTLYLQQKGINPEHYFSQLFMLKRHSKVCAAIAKKRVDAGATYDDALLDANAKFNDQLVVLAESGKIPNDAVAAGTHVSNDVVERVRQALLSYRKDSFRNHLFDGPQGFRARSDEFYDTVRKVRSMVPTP